MIARLKGEVVEKTETALIIDVHGIGYEVQVPTADFTAAILGNQATLYTHDHVRENSHELFGFAHLAAKRLFELLLLVSGVGPKMALAIISLGDVETTRSAIASGDSAFIQRASGVGKRLAERLCVDLKDKVGLATVTQSSDSTSPADDALDALLALGYTLHQANDALSKIDLKLDTQARIKQALKLL